MNTIKMLSFKCAACQQCHLSAYTKGFEQGNDHLHKVVIGRGNDSAKLVIVGEAPGEMEEKSGVPFVGKSGILLNKMLESVYISQNDCYITNLVKCRLPKDELTNKDRPPNSAEIEACKPWLLEQIQIIKPKVVLLLGATAMQGVLGIKTQITKHRGMWWKLDDILYTLTFHPSYLLRNPSLDQGKPKWQSWMDMMELASVLDGNMPKNVIEIDPSKPRKHLDDSNTSKKPNSKRKFKEKWSKGTISIVTRNGLVSAKAEIFGYLAIHETTTNISPSHPTNTNDKVLGITHIPSGLLLMFVPNRPELSNILVMAVEQISKLDVNLANADIQDNPKDISKLAKVVKRWYKMLNLDSTETSTAILRQSPDVVTVNNNLAEDRNEFDDLPW